MLKDLTGHRFPTAGSDAWRCSILLSLKLVKVGDLPLRGLQIFPGSKEEGLGGQQSSQRDDCVQAVEDVAKNKKLLQSVH
jgi:hypothetical protein